MNSKEALAITKTNSDVYLKRIKDQIKIAAESGDYFIQISSRHIHSILETLESEGYKITFGLLGSTVYISWAEDYK